jgi:hypothetical protein
MAALLGLFTLSVAVALIVVWFIVTREVARVHAVILAVAALTIVSAICVAVGYLGLRVHISDHYEINLVMLRFFVLPPIAAGVIAGLLSAAMFGALKKRDNGPSNV